MVKKPKTVKEMARMGGLARARAFSKAEIRKWGRMGGRPSKLGARGISRLKTLLESGKSHEKAAKLLGVSVRTVGRAVARLRERGPEKGLGDS
jgi:hypothetical protein